VGLSTGGTGYGDPLDRDPAAVERDVAKELVSVDVAHDVYGVVIDPRTHRVDAAATEELRRGVLAARLERGTPYDDFEAGWSQRKPDDSILEFFGSWPEGNVVTPVMRP
jgi:acetophenone carboxylase